MAAHRIVRKNSAFCMVFQIHLRCERDAQGSIAQLLEGPVLEFLTSDARGSAQADVPTVLYDGRFGQMIFASTMTSHSGNAIGSGRRPLVLDVLDERRDRAAFV